MPVRVERRGSQHCVVKVDTGELEKCYDDAEQANKYASALNIAYAKAKGYVHNDKPLETSVVKELSEMTDIE